MLIVQVPTVSSSPPRGAEPHPSCTEFEQPFVAHVHANFGRIVADGYAAQALALAVRAGEETWATTFIRTNADNFPYPRLIPWQKPVTVQEVIDDWNVLKVAGVAAIIEMLDHRAPPRVKVTSFAPLNITIDPAARDAALERSRLDLPFGAIILPMNLLGRIDAALQLHAEVGRKFNRPTMAVASALMQIGDWPRALHVLELDSAARTDRHVMMPELYEMLADRDDVGSEIFNRLVDLTIDSDLPYARNSASAKKHARKMLAGENVEFTLKTFSADRASYMDLAALRVAAFERAGRNEDARQWQTAMGNQTTELVLVEKGMRFDTNFMQFAPAPISS